MINEARIEVNLNMLNENIEKLFTKFNNYKVKFIDLRNNCFGLGISLVNNFYDWGFNYGFTTTLGEAIKIRKYNLEMPILIKEAITGEKIYDAINNNITITISNLNNLQEISLLTLKDDLKIHLLIDNGTNIMGLKSNSEVIKAMEIINQNKHLLLEGIYTNFATYGLDDTVYYEAMHNFLNIINPIKDDKLIIHANEVLMYHPKMEIFNGIKFDLTPLGLLQSFNNYNSLRARKISKIWPQMVFKDLELELSLPWALTAYIKDISPVLKNTLIGRNYLTKEDMRVGVINIGHKDGITKALKVVVVNNEVCDILTDNIDEIFIKVGDNDKINDKVYLISEYNNIDNVLLNLRTNRYYLMSILNNNLKRVYVENEEEKEISYLE